MYIVVIIINIIIIFYRALLHTICSDGTLKLTQK